MEFKVLSHACLLVKSERHSIVIDPWLIGSCYWRSWWNFPKAVFDESELAEVDAVVISHVHWDHWHAPTLKRFFRGKRIIVPHEPSGRSRADLVSTGFKDVTAVPHAQPIVVGDITVTMYQFGLFLNDAAIVVEADGVTLLDANDAKIAGFSLSNLLSRHARVDFAFRSHSSANPRICFEVTDHAEEFVADDRHHYFRAFTRFMDVVQPRFAVPFASNHCHLHDDVFDLNAYISNPLELREHIASEAPRKWQLQVMLPGSSWSSTQGFSLRDEAPFSDLPATLARYRKDIAPTLERFSGEENAVRITEGVLKRLRKMLAANPLRWRTERPFALSARWPDGRVASWRVDAHAGTTDPIDPTLAPSPGLPVIVMPAIVLRDAVLNNMFHHAGISKRARFSACSRHDLRTLQSVFSHLERVELGVLPLKREYLGRLMSAYARRWRELLVYVQASWLVKIRRQPVYIAEELILERGAR